LLLSHLIRQELSVTLVGLCSPLKSFLVNLDAKTRSRRYPPCWSVHDWDAFAHHVAHHVGRSLLITLHDRGQRQHDVLRGSSGNTELTVRVLADLATVIVDRVPQSLESPQRANPVRTETVDVGDASLDPLS